LGVNEKDVFKKCRNEKDIAGCGDFRHIWTLYVRLRKSVPKSEQQHTQWQQRAEEDVAKPKSSDGKNLDMENKYKNKALYWKQWLIFSESLI